MPSFEGRFIHIGRRSNILLEMSKLSRKKWTGIDADTMMTDMDEVSIETSADDFEAEVHDHDNAATSSGFSLPQPPAKKQKSQGKVFELSETLLTIAEGVKELAVAYKERDKRVDIPALVKELEKLSGITDLEIITFARKLASERDKVDLFYARSLSRASYDIVYPRI